MVDDGQMPDSGLGWAVRNEGIVIYERAQDWCLEVVPSGRGSALRSPARGPHRPRLSTGANRRAWV